MSNIYAVGKIEYPLWELEINDFLTKVQQSGHRLAKNYYYDYLDPKRADEITILIQNDSVVGMCCMLKWNPIATRVIYRWARDRDIPRKDHVYGELSKTILKHQLPLVKTPFAFIGLDGNRKYTIQKWAAAAKWNVTEGYVLPDHYQQIAYIKLFDTNKQFNCKREYES